MPEGRLMDRAPGKPGPSSVEARLALLEAEREILRTMHAYGNAMDYGDEDAFLDCWLEDAQLHWPNPPYEAPFAGHDRLREAFRVQTHAPAVYHKHFVVDPRIEVDDDGDTARAESYFALLENGDDGPYLHSFGRYVDVLQRCPDGRWRLRSRQTELEASSRRARPGHSQDPA